jgi:hypothetical protein
MPCSWQLNNSAKGVMAVSGNEPLNLVVAVAQTCEISRWVSVICHTITNVKNSQWQTAACWQLPHYCSKRWLVTLALLPLLIYTHSSHQQEQQSCLSNMQCLHNTTNELWEFWYTIKRWKGTAAMPIKLLGIQLGDLTFPCKFQMYSWLLICK